MFEVFDGGRFSIFYFTLAIHFYGKTFLFPC
jgi:hypothetical protein